VGDPLQRLRRAALAVALCAAFAGAGTHLPSPIPALAPSDRLGPAGPSATDPWAHLFLPAYGNRSGTTAVTPVVAPGGVAQPGGVASLGGLTLAWTGIPAVVLDAYRRAAARMGQERPGCNLTWPLLAAIGRIESGHARAGAVNAFGTTWTPILGPQLDGTGTFAVISDTDGGSLDGDSAYDRAVGPMQFLPGTWRLYGRDGNGDSRSDPHNVFDAALAAASYLCVGGRDLSDPAQLRAAVFTYNHSDAYVATVLAWAQAYTTGAAAYHPPLPVGAPARGGGGRPVVAAPPGTPSPTPSGSTPTPGTSPTSPPPTTPPPTTADTGSIVGSVVDDVGNPIAGVRITLAGGADQTTLTDTYGAFSFGALPPGTYHLTEDAVDGYLDKSANEIPDLQLAAGELREGLKFEEQSAAISAGVFVDGNDNGTPDEGEQGIPGVPVRLSGVDVRGAAVDRELVTDPTGIVTFDGLASGVYTLIETTQPADYNDGKESAPPLRGDISANDEIRDIPLAAGVRLAGFHFGELPPPTPSASATPTDTPTATLTATP